MEPPTLENAKLLYLAEVQFTHMWDFGVSMEELLEGKQALPPQGARFDHEFEGELQGPRLKGTFLGTDYLTVRGDGQFILHLHARVQTEDGAMIAFTGEGLTRPIEGTRKTKMQTAIIMLTAAPDYLWVNNLQVWSIGILDTERGQLSVKAYSL